MYRMIVTNTDGTTYKMFFDHIADARDIARSVFDESKAKSVVIATKHGNVKFYQNKTRPNEVWIN